MIPAAASKGIREAFARCQHRFPTIALSFDEYVARAEKCGVPVDLLHHEDLFLATACARGDRIAWEYFADDYLPLLRRLAAQACRQFQESEDVAQEIIASLMVDHERLGRYDGRGALTSWLRVAVARTAIDRFRRIRREVPLEDTAGHDIQPAAAHTDRRSEEESLDVRWGTVLARVLAAEIERLAARDRLLLALYYLNDVPLKSIGLRFGVHEATASRWLDRIRRGLRRSAETELRRTHGLRPRDAESLWELVAEEEGFSLKELLK